MKLRSLQGRHPGAEALVAPLRADVQHNRSYHHYAYTIAQIHARAGRSPKAIRWLKETVATEFFNYPLLASDAWLNPIRSAPEFKALLARMRTKFVEFRAQLN